MPTIARHCPLLTYLALRDVRPLNTVELSAMVGVMHPSLHWYLAHVEVSKLGRLEVDTAFDQASCFLCSICVLFAGTSLCATHMLHQAAPKRCICRGALRKPGTVCNAHCIGTLCTVTICDAAAPTPLSNLVCRHQCSRMLQDCAAWN